MKLSLSVGYDALALLSYETAHANGIRLEIDDAHEVMEALIDRDFGKYTDVFGVKKVVSQVDNKITACYSNGKEMLFVTYWDGNIYIGPKANIMQPFDKPPYYYRCIPPRGLNMTPQECQENLMRHWKP